ncbi:MAG: hypothetical protein ACM3N4_03690 [Nitrososphaerota archaeon]
MTTSDVQQTPRDPTTHDGMAQPAAPIDRPPGAPPARTGRGWNWFLRMLGVGLALGAGMGNIYAVTTIWWNESGGLAEPGWWPTVGLVGCGVLAVAAAALVRSWWALLIVPLAVWVGAQLGLLLRYGLNQDWTGAMATFSFLVLLVAVLPAILGTVIGVPIGKWIARRRRV